jgi:hypothetical protein
MIKDLILIACIVIASFIFKTSTPPTKSNLFDPQMMFILLSLAIVILHKIFYIKKFNKLNVNQEEGFQLGDSGTSDLANELLNFTSGQKNDNVSDKITSMSEAARKEYLTQISNLNNQVSSLNDTIRELKGMESGITIDESSTNQRLDLQSMQQMQNNQIAHLKDKIKLANNLLQQQEIEENAKKYKPIKVYSSCAVSSADGAFTEDTFTDTQTQGNDITTPTQQIINTATAQQSGNNNVLGQKISEFLKDLKTNNLENLEIH